MWRLWGAAPGLRGRGEDAGVVVGGWICSIGELDVCTGAIGQRICNTIWYVSEVAPAIHEIKEQ